MGVGYVVELSGCLVRFLNVFYIWFFECVLSGYDFVICVKVLQFYVLEFRSSHVWQLVTKVCGGAFQWAISVGLISNICRKCLWLLMLEGVLCPVCCD